MRSQCAVLLGLLVGACGGGNGGTYTLYSTSATGGGDQMRIHVATFDSSYGEQYNEEKCEMGRRLFQQQAGVIVRYWCEKGRYRN